MSIFQHKKNDIEKISLKDIFLYRSVFRYINSNMYILLKGKNALIIDPNPNNDVINLLKENQVEKVTIILTHEHRDHIYGIYLFQENFETEIICTNNCANYISDIKNARPVIMHMILDEYDKKNNTNLTKNFMKEYIPRCYQANKTFEKELSLNWNGYNLELFSIEGHSKGSSAIILNDEVVFTGDSLLKDFPIITRFLGGSTKNFENNTIPFLEKRLNPEMSILPGHGNPFKLNEIMKDGKIYVELK